MKKKQYCDMCKKEVKCKVIKYENNIQICKKHINKIGYFNEVKP